MRHLTKQDEKNIADLLQKLEELKQKNVPEEEITNIINAQMKGVNK